MSATTPKCPKCGSIIYSRRNMLCGVCGERLPQDLLFTPEERKVVEGQLGEMDHREQAARSSQPELSTYSPTSSTITGTTRGWNIFPLFRWFIRRFTD